ncbi:hypothetical protein JL720_16011 [Aureococcus anophagefferens]|nr:hypothetical protein JL720_16011 [Aureococcus anophagefferens]
MALVAATTSMAPAPEVDDFATLCEVETAVVAKMQGDERGGFDLCEQLSHGWAWAQSSVDGGGGARTTAGRAGRLRVLPTEFGATTADLDGATFAGAAASRDGRVFFAASDGFVHEFEYAARESVLGRVARMVLPGGNPPAPPPPPPNPDAPKKRPPPAGYEGFSAAKCARRDPSAVRRLATALLPPFARPEWLLHPMRFLGVDGAGKDGLLFEPAALAAKIVAVHVVSPLESATVHCVCVDDAGFRFYFRRRRSRAVWARATRRRSGATAADGRRGRRAAARALTLVHVRARRRRPSGTARGAPAAGRRREDQVSAPPTDAAELYGAKVGASFYGNGVFVVAKASGRDADRVLECAVDARDAPRGAAAKPAEPGPSPAGLLLRAGLAPTPSPARRRRP